MKKPNILILIPHDLGVFLRCYGNPSVESPNLDKLSATGIRFTHNFTTCPECTASRGGMMTGYPPHQNGLMGLVPFGWSLKVPHLAGRMKKLGYATYQFGFQHETHQHASSLGYDHVRTFEDHRVQTVCGGLRDFLKTGEASKDQPWFAYAGFSHVHRPWSKTTKFKPENIHVPGFLPDQPVVRKDLAQFHQDIYDMDSAIGTVMETLEQTGLDRETLVIFTSDHGAAFPGAKATFYDPGVQIPLILRQPGRFDGGKVHTHLISNLDITPTILELAGASPPDDMEGKSFLPLLEGREYQERDSVYGALFYDVAYDPVHFIRTKTHKYIRSFAVTDEDAKDIDPIVRASHAGGRWVRVDDFDVLTSPSWQALKPASGDPCMPPREELYDLRNDPDERNNLTDDPAQKHILEDMRSRMLKMMERTNSPLLTGHVPPSEEQRAASARYTVKGEFFKEETAKRMSRL